MSLSVTLSHAIRDLRPKPPMNDPRRLLRVAVGMTIATLVGYWTGTTEGLALVCVGAFLSGIAAVMPHNRPRLSAVFLTTLGEIVAVFAGIVVHGLWWIVLPIVFVGFLAGGLMRAVTVGLSMRVIVVTIIFLAFAEITTSWHTGLVELSLFAAGSLIMAAAQLLPPYEPPHATQRAAVAELYRILTAAGSYGPAILAADRSLALISHRTDLEIARLTELVEQAEEIAQLLQAVRNRDHAADRPVTAAVEERFRAIATAVQNRRPPSITQTLPARASADRLSNALTAAVDTATTIASKQLPTGLPPSIANRHAPPSSRDLIRAEMHWSSPMFVHGIRLACAGVLAQLLGMAIGRAIPADLVLRGHGFWVVVAVVLILFPDYGETMSRGISRTIGTVLGVGLGIGLSFLPNELAVHAVVLTVLYFGYLAFRSCGQAYTMFWVVAWIAALTVGPAGAITRGVETIVGCVLAFVVYLAAPTWHRTRLSGLLVTLLRAEAARLQVIAQLTLAPTDEQTDLELARSTTQSRIVRMEFTEAVQHAAAEPRRVESVWSADLTATLAREVVNISRQTSVLAAFATGPDASCRADVRRGAAQLAGRLDVIADSTDAAVGVPALGQWERDDYVSPNLALAVHSAAKSMTTLADLLRGSNRAG